MESQREIWYEPHPVTPERKKALLAAHYKIVDARYAPPGWVRPDAPAPAEAPLGFMGTDASASVVAPAPSPASYTYSSDVLDALAENEPHPVPPNPFAQHDMAVTAAGPTSAELRAKLDAAGIEYQKHAPKAKLLELASGL
jgi:hypothetical protein